MVGNPANTNCLITQKHAPSIPAANFTCLTRLDMNRATAQVLYMLTKLSLLLVEIFGNNYWGSQIESF